MTRKQLTARLKAVRISKGEIADMFGVTVAAAYKWGGKGHPVPVGVLTILALRERVARLEAILATAVTFSRRPHQALDL